MRGFFYIILSLSILVHCACSGSSQDPEDYIQEGVRLMADDKGRNEAAAIMLHALSMQDEQIPTTQLVRTYYYLSQIYWHQDFPRKALDYALKSLSSSESLDETYPQRLNLINRVASCYYLLPHHNDSAIFYYKMLFEESVAAQDSIMANNACNNMGAVYLSKLTCPEKALEYFEQSRIYSRKRDKDNYYYHYNCSRVFQQMGRWEDCVHEIQECMRYTKSNDLEGLSKMYSRLYICKKHLGKFEDACACADSSFLLTDSLFVVRRRDELKDLTEQYQREKFETELKLQRSHWLLAVVNVVFLALILFVIMMYRNKRKVLHLQQKMENLKFQISREVEQIEPSAENENLSQLYRQQFLVARDLFRSRPVSTRLNQLRFHTDKNYLSDQERLPIIDAVTEVFIDPLQNLRTKFPELTPDECLYAVLCFVGCNNAVISILTKTSEATLRKRRSRFKQKANDAVFNLLMESSQS